MRFLRAAPVVLLAALVLTACSQGGSDADSDAAVSLPPTSGVFDYQLGEPYDIEEGIDVVARDSSADPEPGAYNICYVNGFQTQPGESSQWLAVRGGLLLRDASGEPVIDPDWPDEYVLDPSTDEQRDGILAVIGPIIEGCGEAGFDAVEIDNLDTFTRFDGIDETGALELARAYVDSAHASGLAIGQKNAAELAGRGQAELGFDFAVTEECSVYGECAAYSMAYGEHVLQIEYVDDLAAAGAAASVDSVCDDPDRAPLAIIRDRDLTAPGSASYARQQC